MKGKKWLFLGFALLIVSIPLFVIWSSEDILEKGTYYKFRLQARDPFDPFRGKFLRINLETLGVPTNEANWNRGDVVYLKIAVDSTGYAYFEEAFKEPPKKGDYIKSEVLDFGRRRLFGRRRPNSIRSSGDPDGPAYSVAVRTPDHLRKYYINEEYAKAGEMVLMEEQESIYVGVRVLNGECRMQDIYVHDTPLMEYLESK